MNFHQNLKNKGIGAKDWINSFTEVEYLGDDKFGASITRNRVFKDKTDDKWKKHKLTDNSPDYILVQSAKCCVEVYPYYAKYYDVNHEEARLYEERWVVQRLFKEPDEWRDVDAYNPVITVEEYSEPAGDVVKVTVTYDTDYGSLLIKYIQRDGTTLKHDVIFTNTSGSTETFRVLQRWAGIVGNKVKWHGKNRDITKQETLFGYVFDLFDGENFAMRENQSAMFPIDKWDEVHTNLLWEPQGSCNQCGKCCEYYWPDCPHYDITEPDKCKIHIDKEIQRKLWDESYEDWKKRKDPNCPCCFMPTPSQLENLTPECGWSFIEKELTGDSRTKLSKLQPVSLDIHAQGLKADFIFERWILAHDESLEIDPDIATLDNPTEDGFLERSAVTPGACPTGTLTRDNTGWSCPAGGESSIKPNVSRARRSYFEWPIASLSGATLTANPIFKYHARSVDTSTDLEINPLTEEQPSSGGCTDLELWGYCVSGIAYVDPFNIGVGENQSQDLGGSAKTDLQSAMTASQSWFAIAMVSPADECPSITSSPHTYIRSENYTTPTPPPTLYVEYEPPGPPPTEISPPLSLRLTIRGKGKIPKINMDRPPWV